MTPLRRVGRFARWSTAITSTVFINALGVGSLVPPEDVDPPQPEWAPIVFWILLLCACVLFLRSPFLGMNVRGERLLIHSWWRTRSLALVDVTDVSDRIYDGMISGLRPDELLRRLHLEVDNREIAVNVSLTFSRASGRDVEAVRKVLGLPDRVEASPRRAWRRAVAEAAPDGVATARD